jgi:hypothetical protein
MQTGQWQAGIFSDLKLLVANPFRVNPKPGPLGLDF